jgi:hypothetical protein
MWKSLWKTCGVDHLWRVFRFIPVVRAMPLRGRPQDGVGGRM